MENSHPVLVSCKPLTSEYNKLKKIEITSETFSLGRSLNNSVVIPFLSISRNHCSFKKLNDNEWVIEDNSSFGIEINGDKLGKGCSKTLQNGDTISLEPSLEFMYKFMVPTVNDYEVPTKRRKLEEDVDNNLIKTKLEQSQTYEIKHLEEKIQNTKHQQTTSTILKNHLELDMKRKIKQLEADYSLQINNIKGEKNEVEKQKALLIEERDLQLATVRAEMEGKINDLMDEIQKLNETETELLTENSSLKEKLKKEREEFLAELTRESSSKQDLLDRLEAKMREQEEIRRKEKEELEETLRRETEQLRLAKEKELKELEEQKQRRELELFEEMNNIKKSLAEQVELSEQQRLKAELELNGQMEQMKKVSDEDKVKMELLVKEREDIQNKLAEAVANAEKAREVLENQVREREIELAALAAERVQREAERSGEVICSLQEQLERIKSQLELVETEKNSLLKSAGTSSNVSKEAKLQEVGEVMESELQCSICGELFVAASTLNCSHTFCKYCIDMWKKKKKDCPICRAPIKSECKSIVLDSFIAKMVETLSEDMKTKRQELLASRKELEAKLAQQAATRNRRSSSYDDSYDEEFDSEEGEEYFDNYDEDDHHSVYIDYFTGRPDRIRRRRSLWPESDDSDSDTDSGSDDGSDTDTPTPADAPTPAGDTASADVADAGANVPNGTAQRADGDGVVGRRRRGRVAGLPGAYYGGYGRCFSCGARGHWAPGCPLREP